MEPEAPFEPEERVLLVDDRGRRYLIALSPGSTFHFHRGSVTHDAIIGEEEGTVLQSSDGHPLLALRPTLSDFILKMTRGAQVIYPKDIGTILVAADISPGATVVEAGIGSGALTIALLRAVGPQGRVISYEIREDFAATAKANIEAFLGKADTHQVRIASIYDGIPERGVDRVVLDLPEPWRAVGPAAESLRGGGILASYLPTVPQVQRLTEELRSGSPPGPRGAWRLIQTSETLLRPWHVEGQSVRPEHRMVAHTGFLTIARRISAP